MSPASMLATILGILLLLALVTVRTPQPVHIEVTQEKKQVHARRLVRAVEHNPFLHVKYEQEQDPLLYVDDGTYYRQPIAIEGNRFWIEDKRPQINDLEWGQPLYSDRWALAGSRASCEPYFPVTESDWKRSNGLYNGSYKTYST